MIFPQMLCIRDVRMLSRSSSLSFIPAVLVAWVFLNGCASNPQPSPFRLEYLIAGGEQDVDNDYSSVVQVLVPDKGACSGVLAGPNLVLTAAHCLCLPPPDELEANKIYSVTGVKRENELGLKCSQTVQIKATLYTSEEPQDIFFDGRVRIQVHDSYMFQTDQDSDVVRSEMDLAAVYLGSPLAGVKSDGRIPDREIHAAEFLVAVGFGHTGKRKMGGVRYFGTAKVLDLEISTSADKVFAFGRAGVPFRSVYALKGDSGGPCFREEPNGPRWLIGILSHSAELDGVPVTFFTSTFHHREWIKRQKALSEQYANSR